MPRPGDRSGERCDDPTLLAAACPSRAALDLVSDKWAVLVLYAVGAGVNRHGEMRRRIEGVTQKMLTQTLRELERGGLLHREEFDDRVRRVEYSLTDLGAGLLDVVQRLCDWAVVNMGKVEVARASWDARRPAAVTDREHGRSVDASRSGR